MSTNEKLAVLGVAQVDANGYEREWDTFVEEVDAATDLLSMSSKTKGSEQKWIKNN